ncbi:MAG: hypothetical protein K1X89_25960 [Myxococcaceae bacterium]|nr:hypothetical protein [Myxococcaceae bacterium]
MRALPLALAFGVLAGCTCEPSVGNNLTFACLQSDECTDGYECRAGRCRPIGSVDDAGVDAGSDAGVDAGLTPDAGADGGFDAGLDAGSDAGSDAGTSDAGHWPERLQLQGFTAVRAGACSQATLLSQRADGTAYAVEANVDVAVSAAPQGLTLFAGGQCAGAPITALTLATGASSAALSAKANTGQRYTVSASLAGTQGASAPLDVLPVVRRGECTLATGMTTVSCPVSPPQTATANTALFIQVGGDSAEPSTAEVSCRLGSVATVDCDRKLSAAPVVVAWQTVELPDLAVKQLNTNADGGEVLVLQAAGVNPAQAFTLFTLASAGNIYDHTDQAAVVLGGGTVEVRFDGGSSADALAQLQVVELPGLSVSRTSSSFPIGAAQRIATGPASPLATTFALATWSNSLISGNQPPCDRFVRAEVTSTTEVTLTRGNASNKVECTDLELPEVRVERVDVGTRGSVLPFTVSLATGAQSGAFALPRAVDATRSVVFASGQPGGAGQAMGEGDHDVALDDVPGEFSLLLGLDGGTGTSAQAVTYRRLSALGGVKVSGVVVEWNP